MKLKFYKKDDILVLSFNKNPVEDSFEVDNAILEVDSDSNPVSLEILHASKFFNLLQKNYRATSNKNSSQRNFLFIKRRSQIQNQSYRKRQSVEKITGSNHLGFLD